MTSTEMALDERMREQERRLDKLEGQVGLLLAGMRQTHKSIDTLIGAINTLRGVSS